MRGRFDSSLTRVEPFFERAFALGATSRWLSSLRSAAPRGRSVLGDVVDEPGQLLDAPLAQHVTGEARLACFEYPVPAGKRHEREPSRSSSARSSRSKRRCTRRPTTAWQPAAFWPPGAAGRPSRARRRAYGEQGQHVCWRQRHRNRPDGHRLNPRGNNVRARALATSTASRSRGLASSSSTGPAAPLALGCAGHRREAAAARPVGSVSGDRAVALVETSVGERRGELDDIEQRVDLIGESHSTPTWTASWRHSASTPSGYGSKPLTGQRRRCWASPPGRTGGADRALSVPRGSCVVRTPEGGRPARTRSCRVLTGGGQRAPGGPLHWSQLPRLRSRLAAGLAVPRTDKDLAVW